MDYPIPPWLHPQGDPVSEYVQAYQVGASIAKARSSMQMEAAQMSAQTAMQQQKLQAQQEQAARESSIEQQKLEVQKAYHESTMGLRLQQLDQANQRAQQQMGIAKQKIDITQQQAQRKQQAQAAYQAEAERLIDSGVSEPEAYGRAALKFGPQMGISPSGMVSALRSNQPKDYGPVTQEDIGGGAKAIYRKGSPGVHVVSPRKEATIPPSALATLAEKVPDLERQAQRLGPDSITSKVLTRIKKALADSDSQQSGANRTPPPKTYKNKMDLPLIKDPKSFKDFKGGYYRREDGGVSYKFPDEATATSPDHGDE